MQQASLHQAFTSFGAPMDAISQHLTSQDHVLVLAESHETHSLALEPKLIAALAQNDSRFKCVFLEFGAHDDLPASDPYGMLIQQLEQSGFKLKFIDKQKLAYPQDRFKNTELRNRSMAEEITKTLVSRECEAGVLIVGKAHLYSKLMGRPIVNLTTNLQRLGVGAKVINLINLDVEDARDESTVGEVYKYKENRCEIFSPVCPIPIPNVVQPQSFSVAPVETSLEYEPRVGGRLTDFNGFILVP